MLEIRLLGHLEVLRDGKPVPLLPSKKTRALLAYLAATPGPVTRGHLCELLWDGPDDPRAALRWSLTKIRPLLDDAAVRRLVTDHDRVSFEPTEASVDVATLREDVGPSPASLPTSALARAVDRFRGEFLEDLDLPDCYRYHEWWAGEREALRTLRVTVLATLVDRLRDTPDAALKYARARVLVDPFSEAAHLSVIELLGACSRTREALQQYEGCRRMLDGQLGARPSAALERARMALGSARTAADPPSRSREPASPPPSLVGREAERSRIAGAIGAAKANASREVLWISGEPGIGKTRLLEEAGAQMRAVGGLVLAGRGYEAEMVRPYGPWIDALRSTAFTIADAAVRRDLAPLVPELSEERSAVDRHRLFDAVTALLHSLSTERPVALTLDDAQWFDEASAGLLHFVARALAASRVAIVCGARSADTADNAAVAGLLRALRRDGRIHEMPLDRLDAAAIRELVAGISAKVDVDRVFAESEGNALFAIEIARALARGDAAVSDTIEELIADRLAQVDERARVLLPWAAAAGRSFSPEILRVVSGAAPGELVGAMAELERRGVIRPSGALYDFTHDLIREAAYGQLSEPRRRIVHLQLARAFSALPDPQGAFAGDVARHAAIGGDPELAARASAVAGDRSLRMFAYTEAWALAERGMQQLDSLPRETRIPLHMALLRIAVHASVGAPRERNLEAEVMRLTAEAEEAGLAAEVSTGFHLLSLRHHRKGDYAAAHEETLRSAEASRGADALTTARALGNAARCLALIERDIPRAEALLREARTIAAGAGVEPKDIPWGLGLVYAFYGDYEQAVRHLESAATLAHAEQDHWAECECLQRLALIELERGASSAARDRARDMARVAARMGEGSEAPFAATLEALANSRLGEPGADEAVERAIATLRTIDAKVMLARSLAVRAVIDLDRGDVARAEARADEALQAAETVGRRSEIALILAVKARAALARHDAAAARRFISAAAGDLQDRDAIAAHARRALDALPRL